MRKRVRVGKVLARPSLCSSCRAPLRSGESAFDVPSVAIRRALPRICAHGSARGSDLLQRRVAGLAEAQVLQAGLAVDFLRAQALLPLDALGRVLGGLRLQLARGNVS